MVSIDRVVNSAVERHGLGLTFSVLEALSRSQTVNTEHTAEGCLFKFKYPHASFAATGYQQENPVEVEIDRKQLTLSSQEARTPMGSMFTPEEASGSSFGSDACRGAQPSIAHDEVSDFTAEAVIRVKPEWEELQTLPDEKVVVVSQCLLSRLVLSSSATAYLRGSMQSLLGLVDEAQYDTCRNTLNDVKDSPLEVSLATVHNQAVLLNEPWLSAAVRWVRPPTLSDNSRFEVPVALLRFTHDAIDSRLHFRNQQSLFKLFDELQRKSKVPQEIGEPLDVCLHEGLLYSISNRRLFVLLMYQAVHREVTVKAQCILRNKEWANGKFCRAFTSMNEGLGVDPHPGSLQEALHHSRPIFDSARNAKDLLEELLSGSEYEWLLQMVRLRDSHHHEDAHSLTLSHNSGSLGSADPWSPAQAESVSNPPHGAPSANASTALLREITTFIFLSASQTEGGVFLSQLSSTFGPRFNQQVRSSSRRNHGQFKQWLENSGMFVLSPTGQNQYIVTHADSGAALLQEISDFLISALHDVSLSELSTQFGARFNAFVRTNGGRNDGQFKQWLQESGLFLLTRNDRHHWNIAPIHHE